jgi:hypothetical protein
MPGKKLEYRVLPDSHAYTLRSDGRLFRRWYGRRTIEGAGLRGIDRLLPLNKWVEVLADHRGIVAYTNYRTGKQVNRSLQLMMQRVFG